MAAAATSCGPRAGASGCVVAAAAKDSVTSFQRRGPKASGPDGGCRRLASIAGTRPSVRNGQLLVSTGLPALDQLLGRFRTEMWAPQREPLGRGCRGAPAASASGRGADAAGPGGGRTGCGVRARRGPLVGAARRPRESRSARGPTCREPARCPVPAAVHVRTRPGPAPCRGAPCASPGHLGVWTTPRKLASL